ncbi:hypothetical protein V8C34DRAFT_299079 [Trichoderma compactum]
MKRKLPVRRPLTSNPPMHPRADHGRGRDHQEKNNSLYSRCTRLLPPSFRMVREDQKIGIHSWMSRIYNHQPVWIRWLF